MNKKRKNIKKNKSNSESNIVDFIKKSETSNKIQTEQMEIKKMDNLAIELVDTYFKASRKSFIDMGYCAYLILFRTLQKIINSLSYPIYRICLQMTTKEILNNQKQLMHTFKEWNDAPTEGKLTGKKDEDHKNDTLH